MRDEFIEVGGQLVRLDSITRVHEAGVVGSPGVHGYYVHTADGGFLSVSELEYRALKGALMPPAQKSRKPKKEAS